MIRHRLARKPLFVTLLGLAVAGAALSAAHAERRGGAEKMFSRHPGGPMENADTNKDGAIDAAEWNALFAEIDADGNGKLEGEEMHRHHRAAHPEALAFMIAHHADADRNGQVTTAEWKAHVAELRRERRQRAFGRRAALPPPLRRGWRLAATLRDAVGHRQRRQSRRGRASTPSSLRSTRTRTAC